MSLKAFFTKKRTKSVLIFFALAILAILLGQLVAVLVLKAIFTI